MSGSWICPRCQSPQVVTGAALALQGVLLTVQPLDDQAVLAELICCAAAECGGYELTVKHGSGYWSPGHRSPENLIFDEGSTTTRLVPSSRARSYPDYVPSPVRQDYEEACAIEQASPKAAATLARRALQGMIRDYWGVEGERTLWHEIEELKEEPGVSSETWEALDSVRKVGNIGAHMERDINVIIDVEPSEAAALIELIEMLIEEWYIARDRRRQSLERVKQIGDAKDAARSAAAGNAPSPEGP